MNFITLISSVQSDKGIYLVPVGSPADWLASLIVIRIVYRCSFNIGHRQKRLPYMLKPFC